VATITITTSNNDYLDYNDYQPPNASPNDPLGLYSEANAFWGNTPVTSTVGAGFPDGTVFNWSGPSVSGAWSPIAYPHVGAYYGFIENQGTSQQFTNLISMPVSSIGTLTATYSVTDTNLTDSNVAFDFWLLNPAVPNPNWTTTLPQTEIEIYAHTPPAWGIPLGGTALPSMTIDGISGWYVRETTTHGAGNNPGTWQYISVQAPSDVLSGTIDIGAILKGLVADGAIQGTETMSAIDFGSEIGGGSGSLTINNFSTTWTEAGSTPPPPTAPTAIASTVHDTENAVYAFALSDFGYSDVRGSTDVLASVKVTSLPTSGALDDNGVAVTAGQVIVAADISGGHLTFTPVANSTTASSFNFDVTDTVDHLTSATPAAMTIDVGTTTPPPPPPTPSPAGTIVLAGSTSSIIDSHLNAWTIHNAIVDENGAPAGYSANVKEIVYDNSLVYQENTAGGWWDWNGTTWAATSDPLTVVGQRGGHHHG
jgi:hypothetical protein